MIVSKLNNVLLILATLHCAGQALADQCGGYGETAFYCVIEKNSKAISVCVNNNKIMRYQYGATNALPELELYANSLDNFDGFFNHGIGRYIWHEAIFPNAGYSYAVSVSIDKMDENHSMEGQVTVFKGDSLIAELKCNENSIFNNMDILY